MINCRVLVDWKSRMHKESDFVYSSFSRGTGEVLLVADKVLCCQLGKIHISPSVVTLKCKKNI